MVAACIAVLGIDGHRTRTLIHEGGPAAPAASAVEAERIGSFHRNNTGIEFIIQGDALLGGFIVERHVVARHKHGLLAVHHEVLGLGVVPAVAFSTSPCHIGRVTQSYNLQNQVPVLYIEFLLGGGHTLDNEVVNTALHLSHFSYNIFAGRHGLSMSHHLDDRH